MIKATNYLRTEAKFVDRSLDSVAEHFTQFGNTFFCCEVGVGRCIVDIAGFVMHRSKFPLIERPFTITESIILAHLRNHGATRIDLLEQRCGLESGGLRKGNLDRLKDRHIIRYGAGGQISLENYSFPISIIAIEAKLMRWRDALRQATEYKKFADQSFVLLPSEYAGGAISSKNEFKNAGVGLFVFDNQSGLDCIVKAARIGDHGWRRDFVLSSLLTHAHEYDRDA
tara:strand:- start:3134 stop:3814 length:681 start_codon:yes stop_codon:yes gene_type:complete